MDSVDTSGKVDTGMALAKAVQIGGRKNRDASRLGSLAREKSLDFGGSTDQNLTSIDSVGGWGGGRGGRGGRKNIDVHYLLRKINTEITENVLLIKFHWRIFQDTM